jgi:hypothetical protein
VDTTLVNGDEIVRAQLREQLLDQVPPPSDASREIMFARTFAAAPGAGAELLPPDDLFDPHPDDDAVEPAVAPLEPAPSDGDGHHGPAGFDGGPSGHDAAGHEPDDWYGHARHPHDPGDPADPGHGLPFDHDGFHGGGAPGGTGW